MSNEPSSDNEFDEASKGIVPNSDPVIARDSGVHAAYAHLDPADQRKKHADQTRKLLAVMILGVVLALDILLTVTFIWGPLPREDFSQAIANLAGPQALAAAVIGFYYGKTSEAN